MTYTIQQLSAAYHLPASTLRYYEQVGLLTDVERDGKHRIYTKHHFNRLGAIQCFKETGMSLKQIERFFYHEDVTNDYATLVAILSDQNQSITDQLALLIANQQHIEKKLAFYKEKKSRH